MLRFQRWTLDVNADALVVGVAPARRYTIPKSQCIISCAFSGTVAKIVFKPTTGQALNRASLD